MKILITGIAGFIGSRISMAALKAGHHVVGIDDLSQGNRVNVPKGIDYFEADLAQQHSLEILPNDIDVIMHLAGQSSGEVSFDNPVRDLEKNVISTLNLIHYGIKNKVKKIIYASSMSVYGKADEESVSEDCPCNPLSCYGVGKLAAENYLKIFQKQLPFVIFRMFNVYGPGQDLNNLRQGMISIYVSHILKNQHIPLKGSINRFRDFIYIDDVVDVWIQAVNNEAANNEIFNLGTGKRTTVEYLLKALGVEGPKFTWSELEGTLGDSFGLYANILKLEKYFKIKKMIPLEKGLNSFIGWAKKQEIAF